MMPQYRKLTTLCYAAVLAFGLAACGGGGTETAEAPMPGPGPGPDPALGLAQMAADAAADAAKTAADGAAAAVVAVADDRDADVSSYTLAVNASNDAQDAYMAAKAASDAAQDATSVSDAQALQADAEAEQAKAEDALADAMMYTGMVAQAKTDADAAAAAAMAEADALEAAQEAAMMAANAAKTASDSAAAALDAAEDGQASDMGSYIRAQIAAEAAMAAYTAAMAASDAAAGAGTSGDAEAQQMIAETEKGKAEAALADAMMYATMVTEAHTEATALSYAMMAASNAAMEARTAADNARAAAVRVAELEPGSPSATAADMAARDAEDAALLAEAASTRAQAATTSEAAAAEQMIAEAQRDAAQTGEMVADSHKTTVEGAKDEMDRVADARTAAMTAAGEARTAATQAREHATTVATLLGAGAAATSAADSATAAEMAALAAETANTLAQATGVSADDAETQQAIAMAENEKAKTAAGMAKQLADAATASMQAAEIVAIGTASRQAKVYSDSAKAHYEAAMGKAADAHAQVALANAAVKRAERARTDINAARTAAMTAMTEAGNAASARDAAEAAKDAAQAAYMAAMNAATAVDAEAEREKAKAQDKIAEAHHMGGTVDGTAHPGAGPSYMAAKAAVADARAASNRHVLGLFTMANAYHIDTAADPDANVDETEQELIAKNKAEHLAAVDAAISATVDNQGVVTSSASAMWPSLSGPAAGADGEPGNEDDPEHGSGLITVTATVDGEALMLTRAGPGEDGEADTDDDIMANFTQEDDLGGFAMFQLSNGDSRDLTDTTAGVRAIVFTDKEQANERMEARTITVNNVNVTAVSRIGKGETPTGPGEPGTTDETRHDFSGTYDHDGNDDTDPLTGTFDCVDPNLCSHTRIEDNADTDDVNEEEVISISGYKFTGTGTTPAVPSVDDMNYIAFGFWLNENTPADNTRLHAYTFGAYHSGGTQLSTGVDALTGEAIYRGEAAGVRSRVATTSREGRVDFFSGDATLTAKFGAADANGSITGSISNIVAGGDSVSEPINLSLSDQDAGTPEPSNIDDNGTFDGRAWMGSGSLGDDGEYDRRLVGTWSGAFYSHSVDNGEVTAHGSVAGTFGVTDNPADASTDDPYTYVGAFGAHCGSDCD